MLPVKSIEPVCIVLPVIYTLPLVYVLPFTVNAPVISVLVLILKPFACEIDAVAEPSDILFNSNPVIPLAGIS